MRTGRVYKLSSKDENCNKVYIGSTKSPYVCIRLAHHRERHRKGWQDYQGIFDAGEPKLEILETMEFEEEEGWRLRQAEQKWADMTENTINIRRCYVSPTDRKNNRNARIKKYHQSEKGKLAVRKAAINHRLRKTNVSGLKKAVLLEELEQINLKQQALSAVHCPEGASCDPLPEIPPQHLPHQSDEVLSDKE